MPLRTSHTHHHAERQDPCPSLFLLRVQRDCRSALGMPWRSYWKVACKECGDPIDGWITYHREGNNDYTAYCHACTDKDPANKMDRNGVFRRKEKWTERVRCASCSGGKDGEPMIRCNECCQSCRLEGGSPVHCLRYWGWGKSKGKKWYCPRHTKERLTDQPLADPACDCPERWPCKPPLSAEAPIEC